MRILVIGGCVLLLVVFADLILGFVLPARRSQMLEQKARELRFRFAAGSKPFENTDVQGLSILPDGAATTVENLMERAIGDFRLLIFDLSTFGETATVINSVAAFRVPSMHLPVFQIGEKNVIGRVIEQFELALGKKLSEFEADHEFTRHFFVHCTDEGEVRTFLTPAKLAYVREHAEHFHVESSPDWLLIYRPGFKVQPENLKEFSEITTALATTLLSIQGKPSPAAA